jgi:hypothetical protein
MIKLALVASLAFAGLALGSTSSSATQFRSTCPMGAEQFGGRCIQGRYYPPLQPVYHQRQPQMIYQQQRFVEEERYVVVQPQQHHMDQGQRLGLAALGLLAQILMNQ